MTTTIDRQASPTNYERLTQSEYTHSMCRYGRLVFSESGKHRMVHTIGFLTAVHITNPDRAYELADSLCKYLDYLDQYGGTDDSPEGRTDNEGNLLKFPSYRVVLSDDGYLGSFTISWYRMLPHAEFMEKAESRAAAIAHTNHGTEFEALDRETSNRVWQAALDETKSILKVNSELDEYRLYWPAWDTQRTGMMSREWVYYRYCHNGGLIFHRDRSDLTQGHWSTHT